VPIVILVEQLECLLDFFDLVVAKLVCHYII
jgi:hypothetical protein